MTKPDFHTVPDDINMVYEWKSNIGIWSEIGQAHVYERKRRYIDYVAKSKTICKFLHALELGAKLEVIDDAFRYHPVHFAAQNLHTDILWNLLNRDRELLNLPDGNGRCAIQHAILKDNVGAVMTLRQFGQKLTPDLMDYAAEYGSTNVYMFLHEMNVGPATVEHLCTSCFCNVALTKYLCKYVNVNSTTASGTTPLIEAASSESYSNDLVEIVLAAGADTSLTNKDGASALHFYLWNLNREGELSNVDILRKLMHPSIDLTTKVPMHDGCKWAGNDTSRSAFDLCHDEYDVVFRKVLEGTANL